MSQPATPPAPLDGAIIVYDAATSGVVVVPAATIDASGNANFNSVSAQGQPLSGGGSGGNSVQAIVDFGSDTGVIKRIFDATVVVSAPWVTSSSVIICSITGAATSTHGIEDALIEGMTAQAENLVAGVGFTLHAYSPKGSWGQYIFNCIGI